MVTTDDASRPYIRQRAFPVWSDPALEKTCTLAHLASTKHNNVDFYFHVVLDQAQQRVSLQFRLRLDVKAAGRSVKRLFLYTIPLESLTEGAALEYTVLDDAELGHSPVTSAVRDAGFAASGRVIRATFHLRQPGLVLTNRCRNAVIRPYNKTSHHLLMQLRSISEALDITFFVKHSDDVQKRLDHVCAGLRASSLTQQDLALDNMNEVDWSKFATSDEPPPYEQLGVLVPGSPDSVVRETSIEGDGAPKGVTSTAKRRRVSPEPVRALFDLDKKAGSASLTAELEMLINTALPSIPPREYAEPRLQPYLDAFRVAVQDADIEAFDRAYARFTALILLDSIHHINDDQIPISDREEVARPDENSGPREDVASHVKRDYLNDIFVVISWSRQRSRTAVSVLWDEFCALGRAAHQAVEEGIPFEKTGGGPYGKWKSKILTMSIVGLS